jgi:putative hydrolase of the HAD superfamily
MIEAVFFDAGETLLSPRPSWSELSAEVLRERGHDVAVDAMRSAWRHTGQHFLSAAEEGRTFSMSHEESKTFWTTLYVDLLDFLGIDDADAPVVLYETFSDPENYDLFPDSLPTIEEFRRRGLRVGVISNFEAWLKVLLDRLGIRDLFDVIAISGDLGWEKPDPRIFKWAMQEVGVDAPSSIHVGDSPHFDAAPAVAVGMHGVLLDRHDRWTDAEGDYPRIAGLGEMIELVDRLGTGG